MDYELAKQLKDAGFPQTPIFSIESPHGYYIEGNVETDEGGIVTTNSVYVPTLEGACGRRFIALSASDDDSGDWCAMGTGFPVGKIEGKSSSEAVAKLWLELHKVQ